MFAGFVDRLRGRRDRLAEERKQMSPEERRIAETPVEDIQAELFVREHFAGPDEGSRTDDLPSD